MERCLSLEALNEASHSHYTRGASNKLENMGNTNTSSFHLGITSSPDPPAVEREKNRVSSEGPRGVLSVLQIDK